MAERNDAERVFIDAHGPDDDADQVGFNWLVEYAQNHGLPRAAIVVSSLRQFESLAPILGVDSRTLKKNRQLVARGITVDVQIERQLPALLNTVPVLGVWVDDKQLDK